MLALMFSDMQAGGEDARPNNPLHYIDLSGQLALKRPTLVARTDRQASRAILGNAVKAPSVDQTTMLRVLLTLNDKPADTPTSTKSKEPAR